MPFELPLASTPSLGPAPSQADFVTSDVAALAAHMRHCAHSRGRLFQMRGGLQSAHAMATGRIVTLGCLTAVLAIGLIHVV